MPCVVLKLRLRGVAPIIGAPGGGGDCTTICTTASCVLCSAMKAILLTYVPAFNPAIFTPTAVTVLVAPFTCPLAGVTTSQAASETAFQLIMPAQLAVAPKPSD